MCRRDRAARCGGPSVWGPWPPSSAGWTDTDAPLYAGHMLRKLLIAARERLLHTREFDARLRRLETPGTVAPVDLVFNDTIEHATYLTDPKKFDREWSDEPYVFTSTACRSDFFHLPLYGYWCGRLQEKPVLHRKQWEYVYIAHALHERGYLKDGARGLGFGVGTEPLADLFASMGCRILGTDLGAEAAIGKGWIETNQHAAGKAAMFRRISPPEQFERNVTFRAVDMNDIPDDLRDFDFAYSSCSIEHVGSLERSKRFVESVLETLRPGGLSIHTTEFVISSDTDTIAEGSTVLWRRRDFREIAERLRKAGHYVAPLDFYTGRHAVDRYVDLPPFGRGEPHLRLLVGTYTCTSFGLIVRKAG
jgi:SAM-dependent methyltransferase